MVISFVLAATVSKKPITYYKPTELNITIDKTFSDLEIETIKLALKQYDEIEGFSIGDITVGKFNKRAKIMITPMRSKKMYYDSDSHPNNLGCNYHTIKLTKIRKSIITINTKMLSIYANTQSRASMLLQGIEIPFEDFYIKYITSITLHEFGHTLGLSDLYEDRYMSLSVMHFANYELDQLTDFDKGMLTALYYKWLI